MMPTETLRAMLDERGVEYDYTDRLSEVPSYQSVSWWFNTADRAEFREYHDGSTQLLIHSSKTNLTPEQAVEATLGRGTCHAIDTGCATAFCSVCGAEFMGSIMTNEPPDYVKPLTRCPECGRKIVEVDA